MTTPVGSSGAAKAVPARTRRQEFSRSENFEPGGIHSRRFESNPGSPQKPRPFVGSGPQNPAYVTTVTTVWGYGYKWEI